MIDNCSTTARLGARKWVPRFDYLICQLGYTALDDDQVEDQAQRIEAFKSHRIHAVLEACSRMRPAVDIFVE